MSACKQSWKRNEKEYQNGIPMELCELLVPWNIFIGGVSLYKPSLKKNDDAVMDLTFFVF